MKWQDNIAGEKVYLWTRQVPQVWDELQANGIYRVKKEYIVKKNEDISDYYLTLYRWFTRKAKKIIPLDDESQYPIWFSVDEELMLQPVENTIILKVQIPKERILICNYEAWGYCVNYWYIPENEKDAKSHAAELKKYGISSDDELFLTSKGNFYPLLKKKVTESWERVFSLKPEKLEDTVAVAWEIRREWVQEVRRYGK